MLTNVEGASLPGLAFVVKVEQTVKEYKDYYGDWVIGDLVNQRAPLQLYAMERLAELTADMFEQFDDLKKHIYALGKIAGRPLENSRRLAASLWETSEYGSPFCGEAQSRVVQTPGSGLERAASPILRPDAPGAVTSADMVNLVGAVTEGLRDAMSTVVKQLEETKESRGDAEDAERVVYRSEKLQAVVGQDFKKNLPVIQDSDADLDKHDAAFDDAMLCYSYGGRKLRDIIWLLMCEESFPPRSTRHKVYNNWMRRAKRLKRIPEEAAEVMKEIRKELRTFIWETELQKMTRLDREFDALAQGNMSHADFRALWDNKLQDMEESGMDMPTTITLYRKYLQKINPEMRTRILSCWIQRWVQRWIQRCIQRWIQRWVQRWIQHWVQRWIQR